MNVKISIEVWVQDLLVEIKENMKGYDVYLGGGYLRDRYCNLDYKDLDIFLVPNGEKKGIKPYYPKGYYGKYAKDCEGNSDMEKRGVAGLIGLGKKIKNTDLSLDFSTEALKVNSTEIQYIIYNEDVIFYTEDLCGDMDMTLNQVMWVPEKSEDLLQECLCTECFKDAHFHGWIEFDHEYDEVRMFCRQSRMKEKFPSYLVLDEILLDTEQVEELREKGESVYEVSV